LKIAKFSNPEYFVPPLTGFLVELGIGALVERLEWWDYRVENEVRRYLRPSGYIKRLWQTDRQTDTGRQRRPRCTHSVAR